MTWKEFLEKAEAAGVLPTDDIDWIDFRGDDPEFSRGKCEIADCDDIHLNIL